MTVGVFRCRQTVMTGGYRQVIGEAFTRIMTCGATDSAIDRKTFVMKQLVAQRDFGRR
jgi:hypothetical protein